MSEQPDRAASTTHSTPADKRVAKRSLRRHPLLPLSAARALLGCLCLLAAAWLAFAPLLSADLFWPEADFIERSPSRAVGSFSALLSWQTWLTTNPLTALTYLMEDRLPWQGPRLHFALNLAAHSFNCLLLWWVLRGLRIKVAFATSLLFSVHPAVFQPLFWSGYRESLCALTVLLISTGLAAWARGGLRQSFAIIASLVAPLLHPLALCQPLLLMGTRLHRMQREGMRALNPLLPYFLIALAAGIFISTMKQTEWVDTLAGTFQIEREAAPPAYFGQQMNHALKRAWLPLEFNLFHPTQTTPEGMAQPVEALHFLPFLLLLPPLLLGLFRFRDHWAPSLLFGLLALSVLLLYFLWVPGYGPGGELVHEDHRLYFALPAFLALMLGTARLGIDKLGSLAPLVNIPLVSLLLLVYATASFSASNRVRNSVDAWENIVETFPQGWAGKLGLIQARVADEASALDFDWMQQSILQILRERPDFMELRLRLLALYRETGRLEQAERQVRQLLFDNPRDLDLLRLFADINDEMGRTWEVINAHERILAQAPNTEDSLRVLTQLHLTNQRLEQAAVLLQRLATIAPHDVDVATAYSQTLRTLSQFAQAESFLDELAESIHNEPALRLERAWVRSATNPLEAREMARRLEYDLRDDAAMQQAIRHLLSTLESSTTASEP